MSAEKDLLRAYGEWQRLSRAENKAIRSRQWNFLLECQAAIKKLQPHITQLTREIRVEWKSSPKNFAAGEKKINAILAQLIELGRQNQSLLVAAQTAARQERAELEQAARNLKQLHQSYVSKRPAAWSSLS